MRQANLEYFSWFFVGIFHKPQRGLPLVEQYPELLTPVLERCNTKKYNTLDKITRKLEFIVKFRSLIFYLT